MYLSKLILLAVTALASSASARIYGLSAPRTVIAGQAFEVQLLTQDYIQSVADIAVAFGVASPPSHAGALGTPIGSFPLGPTMSNVDVPLNFTVTIPSNIGPDQGYILAAAVDSLYGASAEPICLGWNVTVGVGTNVSFLKIQSTNYYVVGCN